MSPHWTESPNLSDTSGQYFTPLGKSRRSYSRARNFPDTHDMMVVFEMLEMDFILIYFFQVRSGQVGEGGPAMYQLCTYPGTRQRQAGSSRYKQGQAWTSRDNKRTIRGNSDKQDTIVSTHFSCHGTVDLIYTMENGSVPLKNLIQH